ncbi:unnamed protein product [Lampetra fluviatilis]
MLPTSREVEVNVSVRHMYLYSREVRGVVARLRAECGSLSVHAVALAHTQVWSGAATCQQRQRHSRCHSAPPPLASIRPGAAVKVQKSRMRLRSRRLPTPALDP